MKNKHFTRRSAGFTIIELFIVIAIIVVLMAILIPAVGYVKAQAKKAAMIAMLGSIGTGLEQYYTDHNAFPPSDPTGAYGGLFDRGGLMLVQGLTGYLDYDADGAGPSRPGGADPVMGFRTRRGGTGKIYGPYMETGGSQWKTIPGPPDKHLVMDTWGNEILYFRAVPGMMGNNRRDIVDVFQARSTGFTGIFVTDDCPKAYKENASGGTVVTFSSPTTPTNPEFLKLLGAKANAIAAGEKVMGRDSYLLVSAGPDGEYFTSDDIVHAGK